MITPLSFVHWVVCPSLYGLWWHLSLLSIGLSVLLFMTSDDPFLLCPLGCLSFSLWPLMTSFSLVHWVVCPSLYHLWWPLSLLSIALSVLLFMTSDDPFLFGPLGCLSFSLWPLMTPFSLVHWVVSLLYGLWWPFLFCPLDCLSFFSLCSLMTPFSFVHWVVCPSLYGLWWLLSLWSIGLSVLLFMASDDHFLFCPLGCLSFSLWPLIILSLLSIGLSVLLFMITPLSFVHWVVCPSLYGLWWHLSLLSIGLSVLLFMTSDDPFLFCPLGCLSFSLWPLMTPFSLVHWVVCPSLYHLWWCLSLLSIGLSVLFMTSDDPFLFCPLGCLSFSLSPLMTPFSFVHCVVCPSLYDLWWPLSLWSIGLSVLLFMTSDDPFLFGPLGCLSSLWTLMTLSLLSIGLSVLLLFMFSDDPFLFCPLGCLSFSLWPLMTPFSLVHWVICPSLYGLWWSLSLLSIGLSVLLFMASDNPLSFVHWVVCPSLYDHPSLFCPLGCLSFSLWPLMTPISFVYWVVCPSLYDIWWPLSLLSIGLSVLLFMASDNPSLFCPLGCLSFSLWPLMTPLSFVHWVVCPSLYGLWWHLSLLSIGLSVLLLFMTSDDPFLFCPLGCLSFSLWPLMTPFSFVHWVVCPSSLYGLWWPLSLLSIGFSVLLFMDSDEPFLFFPLGCLSFSLWPLMTPLSFFHWVVCPSLYGLWWALSLLSVGLSILLLFMTSDDHFLFCPLGCLSFFSLWPLMNPFSFVNWVVCPSLYGLWWALSLLSIGLSVLLFLTSDDPFLFCSLGCLSFSLWPPMTPFSFVHWVFCPSLYDLWWPLSLWSIGLSVLLFMTSDDPFLFGPLGCLSSMDSDDPFLFCPLDCLSFSLWPLMTPFSFVHRVVCPPLYGLWWTLSLFSIGLSVLLFLASDDTSLFCPLGCLSFSLWPLMSPFSFVCWVVHPSSLYDLWWPLSLLSIGLSVLLFMASDEPFLFCQLGCLSFSLWPLMSPFSFVHWVVCPSLSDLWWPLSLLFIGLSVLLFMTSYDPFLFCPLRFLSFSLWPLMTAFSLVHWVVFPPLYDLWWPLSLWSIGLSVLYGLWWPFLFCPLDCLSFSLWPLMTPFSFVHRVVCPSLYGLWWLLSLWSIGLSVLLFMAPDDHFLFCPLRCLSFSLWPLINPLSFVHWVVCPSLYDHPSLFCPLGCLSFSLWPLMTPISFVYWVVCPSLYDIWWPLSLLSIGLSVLLFMASDDLFLFGPLGCLSFSLSPLMTPFSFVHCVVCPSLYDLWWPLSLWSIGLSVLLFMTSDDPFLFGPLGCLSSLWTLMTLSLLSIGLSVLLLFMFSDDPFLFCPLGCLSFSLWPLMTPFSLVHWVICPSLYGLWWSLSLLSIGLSVLLFMASDNPLSLVHWVVCPSLYDHPSLFCPLGCLSFSLWPLMNPFSFVNWVVCPSLFWPLMSPFSFLHWVVCPLYDLWWPLSLLFIALSVLLFMASDNPSLFCPLGCLSFSLWPLMTPLSFVHWVVCPSLYGLWWHLSLLSIGLSVLLLFMTSDDPFLFGPLGCLSFSLWPLMTPFSFVHWVVCPSSLYGLWWPLSLLSIGFSVLLFMASDEPFLFFPLGCLSFSLWPLMTPLSFVHWVVCPSLYGLWWALSLLSVGLSILLLFMTSDDHFLFCPLGCLSFFSLWPLMNPFSFVNWVVCPSLYGLWWALSLLSIGLSVLLFMTSYDPFLFCPLRFLSFSLWPLMTPFSLVHWVVCPSLYGLWWHLSLLSIGLSVLLFMTSDDPFLFCPLGCLSFSLWPLMTPFSLVHWVVCPSLYHLSWCLSLLSIGLSVLLFMTSDEPFLFCSLGCLSFFLWPLVTPFSFVHCVVCPSSFYGLWWPLSLWSIGLSVLLFMASDDPSLFCPLGCLSSLWPLMTPFSFVHWVVCPSSLYGLWWYPFSFVHWVVYPSSLYVVWWALSLLSVGLSVPLLFMTSDDEPFLFCPSGCLSFFSSWPLITPLSSVHWDVCPSLYDLWWPLSLFSIGLSALLLFMASDDPFLFCPLACLSFSLWPLMSPFSFVHWVVCPSFYGLWWNLSLFSIGLSVLLLFIASDEPFLFCPLGCLSFFSLWPLMNPFSFVHWDICPSPLYGLWWPLSLCPLGCLSSL